ncbi:D-isomer specific 2-hydroxyacid dehydrogenase family protein [Hyphomicrobium sp. MC1]|uniref:NAD(P)-dependent oxidoreductase n=1 Tax=Hyphomicrobium sp. (strain MC1) TaxID=717785 RepID=UPI000213E923|nr:NAD(P)-dependent oxidoreductase [Hyphomicrobium sp. MC1]CCB66591.1 putative Phosphoglycerate dehydrogenase [Hyphomicrobium sp. MC1]
MHDAPIHVVFAEEDTLFRLMEVALRRKLTPAGEKTLRYFFGDDCGDAFEALGLMADELGLPRSVETTVCNDAEQLDRLLPLADFLVLETARLTAEQINLCRPRTRLVQQFGHACRNIDVAFAQTVGLNVATLNRVSSQSSSDHITALILALARRLFPAHQAVASRRDHHLQPRFSTEPVRNKFNWAGIRGLKLLQNSTVGFVGLGENSGLVARRARQLGLRVLYFKRTPLSKEEEAALGGVSYAPLDELLAQSDFVSLHLPYNAETERYVDAGFFSKMKRGAYLINSARGGIVDEEALYDSLKIGQIAGAALDVYRYEPIPPDCPLLGLDNIIWTPHMAGGQPEYMLEEVRAVLTNISRVLQGERAENLVSARDVGMLIGRATAAAN